MTDMAGLPECITINSVKTASETDRMRKQVFCDDAVGISQIVTISRGSNVGKRQVRISNVVTDVNQYSRRKC